MDIREQPTVTMILSARPNSFNLYSCLESLIQQNYFNLELLVIDNGLKRKTLNNISRILAKADFMISILKREHLRRKSFWTRSEEIHGELIFLASPYVVYDRDCIRNLVSKLLEDRNSLGRIPTVKDAQCQPNQPQSFLEFFRSVYLEARYTRPSLPFKTHTFFSASLMVLVVLVGVIMEIFSGLYEVFSGQFIVTFLLPLYIVILLSQLLSWENIERKWTMLFIPVLRIFSAFSYVLGTLQKYIRFDKILTLVADKPEITIFPTTLGFLFFRNLVYELAIKSIMQLFYLGFTLSLTIFKGSKFVNHIFYGFMLSAPVNYFLSWIREDIRIREMVNKLPFLLPLTDPFLVCLIIGSLVYFRPIVKRITAYSRQSKE